MPKRLLALVLLAIGAIGVYPYIPQVKALFLGQVDMPSTDEATFSLMSNTNANQLVACEAGGPIAIKSNDTQTWNAFRCWSKYPQDLTVTFSLADPSTYMRSVSGSVPVKVGDPSSAFCRSVTLRSSNTTGNNQTINVQAHFETSDLKFSGDIYFPVTVTVRNGNGQVGVTCN